MNTISMKLMGFFGAMVQEGIKVLRVDYRNCIVYLSVPKTCPDYQKNGVPVTPDEFVKNLKESMISVGALPAGMKFRYKVREDDWTKEDMKKVKEYLSSYIQEMAMMFD